MANWKEDMISRIQEKRLAKEIQDMEVDFTKHIKEINQEFDNLCKNIVELDYDSSIKMENLSEKSEYSRCFRVFGIAYYLQIKKNEISITCCEENKLDLIKAIDVESYRVIGDTAGVYKVYEYFSTNEWANKGQKDKLFSEYESFKSKEFNYKEILNTLMDMAYRDVNETIQKEKFELLENSIKEKKSRIRVY